MKIEPNERPELPCLAWCARVEPGREDVGLLHGSGVETRPGAFAEAAWDGDFEAFDPLSATVLAGTAGAVDADGIHFRGATDRLAPLWSVRRRDGVLFVSNSPVFVVVASGETPDPLYPFYAYDLIRAWRLGLHEPAGRMPLAGGVPLRVHLAGVLSLDARGRERLHPGPDLVMPAEWSGYRAALARHFSRLMRNARSPARARPFEPLVSISRGYDSTAAAVLAREVGARRAMTFHDSRAADPAHDDGSANARRLGLDCRVYDRWDYLREGAREGVEVEFAPFTIAANPPLAAAEDRLRGSLFVMGHGGARYWARSATAISTGLAVPYAARAPGLGHVEFRLRVGFLPFAPATIGGRDARPHRRIAASEAMRGWSVGGAYDKPIARRIAEEAGLPRESFGVRSRASAHAHLTSEQALTESSRRAYHAFVARSHAHQPRRRLLWWRARAAWRHLLWRWLLPRKRRSVPTSRLRRRFPFLTNVAPPRIPWRYMFLFQWTVEVLGPRYGKVLGAWGAEPGAGNRKTCSQPDDRRW